MNEPTGHFIRFCAHCDSLLAQLLTDPCSEQVGTFHFAMWTGPQWPNATSTAFAANDSHWAVTADCRHGCLYDLTNDIGKSARFGESCTEYDILIIVCGVGEHTDISATKPAIVAKMRERLEQINATVFSPNRGLGQQKLSCEVGVNQYRGYFGPFLHLE